MSYGTSGTSGDGIPVIIKNKIVYGLVDRTVQAYDLGVADYNALSEEEQLDGNIRFIQGVNASAYQSTNSVWAKLGTTPLAEGLPADCSQAINQIKSNLTELSEYSTTEQAVGKWTDGKTLYRRVFNTTFSGTTSSYSYSQSIATIDIDKVVKEDFVAYQTSNNVTNTQTNFYVTSNNRMMTFIRKNEQTNAVTLEIRGQSDSAVSYSGIMIFYYTKN